MSTSLGGQLLDAVAARIISRYLRETGATGVMLIDPDADPSRLADVDLVYTRGGNGMRAKVKPDPYFGVDPRRVADQEMPFYRKREDAYAFETIAHHLTRDPGWMFHSMADELFYYFLAIDQAYQDVAALMHEDDTVFFTELSVAADELHVIPMEPLRKWFDANQERYTPRPVLLGDHTGWYRIVPSHAIAAAVAGLRVEGPVFSRARGAFAGSSPQAGASEA